MNFRNRGIVFLGLFLFLFVGTGCTQKPLDGIATSHIEGNVPPPEIFDADLKRDLGAYLCKGAEDCHVEYELLRKGATQTGIAYPKFYVWARSFIKGQMKLEGAARLAAINRDGFEVTDFLSKKLIRQTPQGVSAVFPAPLVKDILLRSKM